MNSAKLPKIKALHVKKFKRKIATIAVFAVLAGCVTGFAWPRTSLARAEKLLKEGRTSQAVAMLDSLASRNDARAALRLGTLYWHGEGVLHNRHAAIPYLENAARAGEVQANALLGAHYYGTGDEDGVDPAKAEVYLLAAVDGGDTESCGILGRMYYSAGGVKKALAAPYLARAADDRIPEAAALYGSMLLRGDGVTKDRRLGDKYLGEASLADDPDIDFLVGTAYLEANIPSKALPHFIRAHDGGRTDAGYAIGSILLSRLEPDYAAAAHYLKPLADAGHEEACTLLADLAFTGKGIAKDRAAAYRYLQPAVRSGDPQAMARAGFMLAVGDGVPRELNKGLSLLKTAGANGHSGALVGLGALYYFEKYGMRDRAQALDYWQRAAALGDSRGMALFQDEEEVSPRPTVQPSTESKRQEEMERLRETVRRLEETIRDSRQNSLAGFSDPEKEAAREKARQVVEQELIRKNQSLDRARTESREKEHIDRIYGSSFDMGAQARMEAERNTRDQARLDKLVDSATSDTRAYRQNWRHGHGHGYTGSRRTTSYWIRGSGSGDDVKTTSPAPAMKKLRVLNPDKVRN